MSESKKRKFKPRQPKKARPAPVAPPVEAASAAPVASTAVAPAARAQPAPSAEATGKKGGRLRRGDGQAVRPSQARPQGVAFFESSIPEKPKGRKGSGGTDEGNTTVKSEYAGGRSSKLSDSVEAKSVKKEGDDIIRTYTAMDIAYDEDDEEDMLTRNDPLAPITLVSPAPTTNAVHSILGDSDREMFVMQWPTSISASLKRKTPAVEASDQEKDDDDREEQVEGKKTKKQTKPDEADLEEPAYDEFSKLEPGIIGTLNVHKSGKVRMKIGSEFYDVHRGLDCSMLQEVAVLHGHNKLSILGTVNKKLLVTVRPPDGEDEDYHGNYDDDDDDTMMLS